MTCMETQIISLGKCVFWLESDLKYCSATGLFILASMWNLIYFNCLCICTLLCCCKLHHWVASRRDGGQQEGRQDGWVQEREGLLAKLLDSSESLAVSVPLRMYLPFCGRSREEEDTATALGYFPSWQAVFAQKLPFHAFFVSIVRSQVSFYGTKFKMGRENPGDGSGAAWETWQLAAVWTFLKGLKQSSFMKGQAALPADPLSPSPYHNSRGKWPAWGQYRKMQNKASNATFLKARVAPSTKIQHSLTMD